MTKDHSDPQQGLSTRSIHAGDLDDALGSPHTPLYDSSTFRFDSTQALLDVIDGRKPGYLYTRYGSNPTIRSLEEKLASLDGAEGALAFSSGMAAISSLLLAHGRRGIVCIGDAYGGTLELLTQQLPGLGMHAQLIDSAQIDRLAAILQAGTGLVYFETPTNPTLDIIDIRRVAAIAHAHGALVAVDNTFASCVNQRPLALGADLVMQSATKYLGGHSDLTAGVVAGSDANLAAIRPWRKNLGQAIAPDIAHRLSRSLATLVVRVERHNATAAAIAEMLSKHPKVARVYYPGLRGSPGHAVAAEQMSGFGGMVTFDVHGTSDEAMRVVDALNLITLAPSLGGAESLITQPATTSHHDMDPAERRRRGITDSLIRLSVGLEDASDLIRDLEQALGR